MIQHARRRVGPAIKDFSRTIKVRVADLLIQCVAKLDKSFLLNANGSAVTDRPVSASTEHSSPSVSSETPLVLNEGGMIATQQMLRLVINSIFETTQLTGIAQTIFDNFADNGSAFGSQEAFTEEIRRYLLQLLNRGGENAADVASALEKLLRYEKNLEENRLAYTLKDKLNLDAIYWPNPSYEKRPRLLKDQLPFVEKVPLVDSSTPIGSAGSCFAVEIARRLQEQKFNYVVTEPDPDPATGLSRSCARWGTIFNVPSFRQLIEKAFGELKLPRILYADTVDGAPRLMDPFREAIHFGSFEEYKADYDRHIEAVRRALLACKVFVLTLGVNEVWSLKAGNHVLSRVPWNLASGFFNRRVLTVDENLKDLQRMLDVWRAHNPELKIIVSVSPIPLHATFRGDRTHVVAANCHSKSTLRVVAEEFSRKNSGVTYFPSYETVMYCTETPWDPDLRHVSSEAVDNVMRLFDHMFLRT